MNRYVALLRGVNVGGRGMVAMADLRALLEELGFDDVRTLLQSGNIVFRGAMSSPAAFETRLSAEIEQRLGVRTAVMCRSANEWAAIVSRNPFPQDAADDPARLIAFVLTSPVTAAGVRALQQSITGRETVAGSGRAVYAFYPDGQGRSKLTIPRIERSLNTRATGRNWNTVLKLAELVRG